MYGTYVYTCSMHFAVSRILAHYVVECLECALERSVVHNLFINIGMFLPQALYSSPLMLAG